MALSANFCRSNFIIRSQAVGACINKWQILKQEKMKKKIHDIIGGLLVLLFVYAAFSKLFDYTQFKMQLGSSPLLASYAGIIAWMVPVVELIIATLLTVTVTRIIGLYASLGLLLIFTLYITAMLLSGEHLPCSCGGIIQALNWSQHLVFNLFFMALCIGGIVLRKYGNRKMVL